MATINGTNGDETLVGTNDDDEINGLAGNDTLNGRDGVDVIFGGVGNDLVFAGAGNDTVDGGDGADRLYGDFGQDTIYGGAGDDRLFGANDANDTFYGGTGNDVVFAGDSGGSVAYGGDGNDDLTGGAGNDFLYGEEGADTIEGRGGDDWIYGGSGDDLIIGGSGDDILVGSDGADRFIVSWELGNDFIYGGGTSPAEVDTIEFDGSQDLNLVFTGIGDGYFDFGSGTATGGFYEIEAIKSSDGDDVIDANISTRDLLLDGGDGANTVTGGSGNDTLISGAGDDVLTGGAGNDTLKSGDGKDRLVLTLNGGDDVVLDFDLGDTDGDGFYNDQIDVSALQKPGGGAVKAADVVVTDDGFGNARLTFPEGESIVLEGIAPAQMSSTSQLIAAGIPCFTAGTLIAVPDGVRRVEDIGVSDLVVTRDNGPQPVVWAGSRKLGAADLIAQPKLRPVRIEAGVLGNQRPVFVSRQHGMLVRDNLVRAIHLSRIMDGVTVSDRLAGVHYVHLMFESHQVIFGDGVPSESFYPGPSGFQALDLAQRAEILALFPELAQRSPQGAYGAQARRFVHWRELEPEFA